MDGTIVMIEIKNNLQFINGEYVASTNTDSIDVLSPSTGEVIGSVPKGSVEDAQAALESSAQAQNNGVKYPLVSERACYASLRKRFATKLNHWPPC